MCLNMDGDTQALICFEVYLETNTHMALIIPTKTSCGPQSRALKDFLMTYLLDLRGNYDHLAP